MHRKQRRIIMGMAWRGRASRPPLRPRTAPAWSYAALVVSICYLMVILYFVLPGIPGQHTVEQIRTYEDLIARYEKRIAADAGRAARMAAELRRLQDREQAVESMLTWKMRSIASRQAEIERRHEAVHRFLGPQDATPVPQSWRAPDSTEPVRAAAWLDAVFRRLGTVEREQIAAVQNVEARTMQTVQRLDEAFAELGLVPSAPLLTLDLVATEVGGPFVPLDSPALAFEAGIARALAADQTLAALQERGRRLPFDRPLAADHVVTSRFGLRLDPFLRRPAFHAGVDLRAFHGQGVLAAAAGKVVAAGWSSGYGRMVVLEHGDGVTTRYAHLSSIALTAGQTVEAGALVGRAGRTGRASGTHLHYEARVDGEAVDPLRFLRIGEKIKPLL